MHISKGDCENFQILEISSGKSGSSGISLDKTLVLMISIKYLHIYRLNHTIKESLARNL